MVHEIYVDPIPEEEMIVGSFLTDTNNDNNGEISFLVESVPEKARSKNSDKKTNQSRRAVGPSKHTSFDISDLFRKARRQEEQETQEKEEAVFRGVRNEVSTRQGAGRRQRFS